MNRCSPMVILVVFMIAIGMLGCGPKTEQRAPIPTADTSGTEEGVAIPAKDTYVNIYAIMQDRPWPACLLVCGKPKNQLPSHLFLSVANLTEEEMTFVLSILVPILEKDQPAKVDPIDIYFVTVVAPQETWYGMLQASEDSLDLLRRLSDILEEEHREALSGVIRQTELMIESRGDSAGVQSISIASP